MMTSMLINRVRKRKMGIGCVIFFRLLLLIKHHDVCSYIRVTFGVKSSKCAMYYHFLVFNKVHVLERYRKGTF